MKNKIIYFLLFAFATTYLVSCDKTTVDSTLTTNSIETTITNETTTEFTINNTTETTVPNSTTTIVQTTTLTYYTVTFMKDGEVLKTETVLEGDSATAPTNTDKETTNEYSYQFNGWDISFENVQSNLTVNALYIETQILYEVNFYDYDNETLVLQVLVPYQTNATPPANIEERVDEIYTYTFDTWIGNYNNITENTNIYSKYTRTYTTTGDYIHSDFYNLVSTTFDIENEANIENNITYLIEIFEASSEEEAYRIFNILVYNYNQLTEFNDYSEFKDIFANLESGFLTEERLIDILFNYLEYSNSYFVGISDLKYTWYNNVVSNYTNFQSQYEVILNNQEQVMLDLNQALELLDESLRFDANEYFKAKTLLYKVEKEKFRYFDFLKSILRISDRDPYNLNSAIWNILDKDNIDPVMYDYYVREYDSICNKYPNYQDQISKYYDIMSVYYNVNITYSFYNNIVSNNPDYETFISTSNSLYSTYIQSVGQYFLIKEDLEYWQLQMNSINKQMSPYDEIREVLLNTSHQDLYKDALLIVIDDLQNMILSDSNYDFTELSNLVTYIVNHKDMYGYLDVSSLFESVTKEGLFNTIQSISKALNSRFSTITNDDWVVLNNALNQFISDYTSVNYFTDVNLETLIHDNQLLALEYFNNIDTLLTQIELFLNSITLDEIEAFNTLISSKPNLSQNEYIIEMAKMIDNIMSDTGLDIETFMNSYMYINFFQVDVHIEYSELALVTNNTIVRIQAFIDKAHLIAISEPSEILQETLDTFFNDYNTWYHDFLFSYVLYLK